MDKKIVKSHLGISVIGDLDSGKSTTICHLMYKNGNIDDKSLEKFAKLSQDLGNAEKCKFAFISDKLSLERQLKISIELSRLKLETKSRKFTMYDLPGHIKYLGNFVAGISLGDVALLVVSAEEKEFEKGFANNGQTKQHALLAYTMGMKQIIVGINKMDLTSPCYSQEIFNQIQDEILQYLLKVGFENEHISFIPYNGIIGENLITPSENMKWFKGQTLTEALESLKIPLRHPEKSLRIPIHKIFKIKSKGTCAVGVVKYGKVKMSDNLVIFPGAKKTKCKEILVFHDESKVEALPGDNVGVNLSNISVNDLHRGMVIGLEYNNPPKEAKSFQAQIIVLNHPKQVKESSTIIVDCHSGQVECKINILEKFDRKTGEVVKKNPTGIENGEAALVELTPIKPMVVEKFEDYPSLGRISLRDNNEVIAVGIVKSVINK